MGAMLLPADVEVAAINGPNRRFMTSPPTDKWPAKCPSIAATASPFKSEAVSGALVDPGCPRAAARLRIP